ncbi:iron complex transport system ATP-binding protein [Malonomonas rubra DSM 5091]|uniref:Iron complex transport system ATP-binding protein n=1 Tax=Malonomonas rubra DSM 5091 TaxID=1122189 RepID=A0A1M6NKV4_MALRU|nr:ATP-binding cassette domain-containing protein [Malonomonas rubra]SHJ96351.1 iron complex transport system ATP-binding protein [Malonomonas rubra DSM 5091]
MAELRVENLQFSRDDFRLQLDMVEIKSGEKVAILGENGSGKSTLLQLLCGLLQGHGTISYNNQSLQEIPFNKRAQLFSLLPQFSEVIFPFCVEEVVLFGRFPHAQGNSFSDEDKKLSEQQLEKLDLLHLRKRQFTQLSGGEKRRVMLARVLNQQAPIIYLDEPNSSLDIRHTLEIFELLGGRNETVISPVHDINLAERFFDRFLLLKHGRLLADVTGDQLTPELLTETYDVQVTCGTAAFTFQHQ